MIIADLHNDLLTSCDNLLSQLNFYKDSGNYIVNAYFRGGNTLAKAVSDVNKYLSIKPDNCYLSFEDIGYTDINKIEYILRFFPLYVSLTWNGENNLGFGCNYQDKGLKEKGKEVLDLINRYKLVVDTAHISRTGFYDICNKADYVICSHTAFNSVFKHKRNLSDEQIKIIIEKGGIIGLALYSEFLTDKPVSDLNSLIKQIDFFVCKYGIDSLCFGTDFFGAKNFVGGINNYEKISKILEKLEKIGYNRNSIEKLFYLNALTFINNVEKRQRFVI